MTAPAICRLTEKVFACFVVPETKLAVGAADKDGKEICRAFRNTGSCRFGDDCKYAHTTGAQIDTPPRDYTPKGDCHNWTEKKECRFGDRCRFLHGAADKRASYRPARTESASGEQEVCRQYEKRGKCRFGDKCKHKHVEGGEKKSESAGGEEKKARRRRGPKKAEAGEKKVLTEAEKFDKDGVELCRNFRNNGRCRFGESCTYSHAPGGPIGQPAGGAGAKKSAGGAAKKDVGQCHLFEEAGECKFGDSCRYKHGDADKRDFSAPRKRAAKDSNCREFAEHGSCSYGDQCKFSHSA
jgi:hypothetical protein